MRTDLSLNTNIGYINLEINSNPEEYVHPRNFSYLADTYSHNTLVGEEYSEKTKYIQINLSYGLMLTEKNKLMKEPKDIEKIRIYEVMDKTGKRFIDNFIIYEINMDYFLNLWYNKDTKEIKKEKILIMLGLDKKSLEELSENDKVVRGFMKEVNTVNEDPEFREYISYEEDQRKIQNTLLHKAKNEGKKEIVEGLLKNGVEIETIINSTGLSKEEIENLAQKLKIDPKFREYISYEEDQRKIQNTLLHKAEKEGIEKGINSEKIAIAKNLLNKNMSIEDIIDVTNLSKEQIEKLK